jgi:serine/threonine protein kinase
MDDDAPVLAKIADFGLSAAMMQSAMGRKVDCPVWLAPEIMRNQEYTTKADVYSMGIILWELLTKQQKLFPEVRPRLTPPFSFSHT